MWYSQTRAGIFWIRFVPQGRGVFVLGTGHRELGTYLSPEAAADDVYLRRTGLPEWDAAQHADAPADLSEWIRLDCAEWDAKGG